MDELGKIKRVIEKRAPVDEVLLVLDATTGQNGLHQARVFAEAVDVTGIVLTKLDGTAKGGIVIAVQRELGVPVKLVGLGEGPGRPGALRARGLRRRDPGQLSGTSLPGLRYVAVSAGGSGLAPRALAHDRVPAGGSDASARTLNARPEDRSRSRVSPCPPRRPQPMCPAPHGPRVPRTPRYGSCAPQPRAPRGSALHGSRASYAPRPRTRATGLAPRRPRALRAPTFHAGRARFRGVLPFRRTVGVISRLILGDGRGA